MTGTRPEDTQLEIRFADENPQVVDHFEGEVDKKIELAGGFFCDWVTRGGIRQLRVGKPIPKKAVNKIVYLQEVVESVDGEKVEFTTVEILQTEAAGELLCKSCPVHRRASV